MYETWSCGESHNRPQNVFGVKLCAKGTYLKSFFQPMIWTLVLLVFVSHRAAADQVVITEIMRKPKKADAPQWVELSNLTSTVLDCAQWELKGLNLIYTFADFQPDSPADGFIAPFETWIISDTSPEDFRHYYPESQNTRILGPWTGFISEQKDHLVLVDKNQLPMTGVAMHQGPPWPTFVDGSGYTLENSSPNRNPMDWRNWRRSRATGGTPGKWTLLDENIPTGTSPFNGPYMRDILLNSEASSITIVLASDQEDQLRLENYQILSHPDLKPLIQLDGTLSSKSTRAFHCEIDKLPLATQGFYLVKIQTGQCVDEAFPRQLAKGFSVTRTSSQPQSWRTFTPTQSGNPPLTTPLPLIVINEIMFDPPYGKEHLEFIELHNALQEPVDMSLWTLEGGVQFDFPTGTLLGAGGFAVIAGKPGKFQQSYPGVECLGGFKGKLSNRGERLCLFDALGNCIDEVHYGVEGDWPSLAAGQGSSMELLHPHSDNQLSSAWGASRQSRSSDFEPHAFDFTYRDILPLWSIHDHRELHFYLTGKGHLVLKNIKLSQIHEDKNLLDNVGRRSVENDGATGWLMQGNHSGSFLSGDELHLLATGHGDNKANRIELDALKLEEGASYRLSFDARWVRGTPRMIVRTWNDTFSQSIEVGIPSNLGTPGTLNTQRTQTPPPQIEDLVHEPAVPKPGEPIVFTAKVAWMGKPGTVSLVYRLDASPALEWQRQPMHPSSTVGNVANPTYETTLEFSGEQGDLLEFFVEGISLDRQRSTLPRIPSSHSALCVIDGREIPTDLRRTRLLIRSRDLNAIQNGESASYEFRYPRLSNQYFNATYIHNDQTIRYGASLRASGSAWTRQANMARGKWKLPKDRPFRNHVKFTYDDDPTRQGGMFRHHNRMVRYLLYLLGHPCGENEFLYVILNDGPVMLREEVEPVDSDYLRRNFTDGHKGELYRVDDAWWMSDHWSQRHRDASWDTSDTAAVGYYRNAWMKRSAEEADDFSALTHFFEFINRPEYTLEEVASLMDAEAVLKMTAVLGFVADWDTFTQSRGKNAYFYRRPEDGRFQWLQWDSDLAFGSRHYRNFYGGSEAFVRWVEHSENMDLLRRYLKTLVELTEGKDSRVEAWMSQESSRFSQCRINAPFYRSFFQSRKQEVDVMTDW